MRKERSKIKRINVEYKTFYYKEVKGKQFNIIAILVSGYILNDFKQCSRANAKSKATIKPEKWRRKRGIARIYKTRYRENREFIAAMK